MKKWGLLTLLACFFGVSAWGVDVENYTDLQSVLTAAGETGVLTEIRLTADINFSTTRAEFEAGEGSFNQIVIPSTANILLNLNGYGIKHTAISCSVPDAEAPHQSALIYNKGTLHIINKGTSIVQQVLSGEISGVATVISNSGSLVIDGGIFIGPVGGSDVGKLPVIWCETENEITPNVTINGGTILCDETYTDENKGPVYAYGPLAGAAHWVIKGGIFSTSDRCADMYFELGDYSKMSWASTYYDHFQTGSKFANAGFIPTGYTWTNVPYSNELIPGYTEAYRSARLGTSKNQYVDANKRVCVVRPNSTSTNINDSENTIDAAVVDVTANVSLTGDRQAKFVFVQDGKTLTIPTGKKLQVGEGGIVLGGTSAKIIVEEGATLLANNDIVSSVNGNIELTMNARTGTFSTLAMKAGNIQGKHPNASVTLQSIAKFDGSKYTWQRFAIPTYLGTIKVSDFVDNSGTPAFKTAVFKWDYSESEWVQMGADETLSPFVGYALTINNAYATPRHTFACELVGNGNPQISVQQGWNILANSYTANIKTDAVVRDFIGDESNSTDAAVWIQTIQGNDEDDTSWKSAAFADVFFGELAERGLEYIHPMQAFQVNRLAEAGTLELKYEDYVASSLFAASAPARRAPQAYEDITRAHIVVEATGGQKETVMLYLSEDFSHARDNGFDIPKSLNEEKFNLYVAHSTLGALERVASDDLDNTSITIETKSATSYTMTFDKVTLEGYQITDLSNNTTTEIKAGNSYAFTAEANQTYEGRFLVTKKSEVDPTALEDTKAIKHNGIYSLTGVYMGTNINVLPAGVYVINGQKVVK